jgi:hypothetical protein
MKKFKKQLLMILMLFILVIISSCNATETIDSNKSETVEYADSIYDLMARNISSGGPPPDGIPPIEDPVYVTTEEADTFLEDYDQVFIYESSDIVYIYPQRILVWHEIVNDFIDNEKISITYCPLTGSTIAYSGIVGDYTTDFGTSGKLLNSNLVMYDRATDTLIPQIFGIGIEGELKGIELNSKPVYWSKWSDVKYSFPEAMVLSKETGFVRDYNDDPYGGYKPDELNTYYFEDGILFPVMNEHQGQYNDKKMVIGIKLNKRTAALNTSIVKKERVYNFEIDSSLLVAFYDERIKNVRVFKSELEGKPLTFNIIDGDIVDQHGIKWHEDGFSENSDSLESVTHFEVMWFAWYAFYPKTQVIE